jgi:hypothetical protein
MTTALRSSGPQPEKTAGKSKGTKGTSPLRVSRLANLDDVRGELSRIYREARTRKLDLNEAKGLAYLLQVLSALVKDTDIERRIAALEGAKA